MGIPRSGSTLSCNILNHYENTLALLEPMNVHNIKGNNPLDACKYIHNFVFKSRYNVLYEHVAQTKHSNGMIPTNTVEIPSSDLLRNMNVSDGLIQMKKHYDENFALIIKHNAFFLSIIKDLRNFYDCYAIVRNPLAVLCSWNSVNLPVNRGYIPAGQKFDLELDSILKNTSDILERQIIILNWFFEHIYCYINKDNIFMYENIVLNPDKIFQKLSFNSQLELTVNKLNNNNSSQHYKDVNIKILYERLMNQEGYMWKFYTKNDVHSLYKQFMDSNK